MRNVFLILILANLLLLAWHFWIDPSPPATALTAPGDLAVFGGQPGTGADGPQSGGACLQMGPLPGRAAAQQARDRLVARGVEAVPIARDTQQWLGHWVQVEGLPSAAAAEDARDRLVDGGLTDAYLMMGDGNEPVISLGVFRDRSRADRVADMARSLGVDVTVRDRYRAAVEHWLLIRPRAGRLPVRGDLNLPGDRIMRTESVPCTPPSEAGEG